ncbi:hypothetical protein L1887_14420 [Cichorium endivia]|nr:hypothetical protein L1887_14420 [Cichorium endivia]
MPKLVELDLSSNKFTQIEHVGIWRQCHLRQLSASYNFFNIEMIDSPENVSECSQYALERLDLSRSLNGTIPEPLGRLVNLRSLDLSDSSLTDGIGNLARLLWDSFSLAITDFNLKYCALFNLLAAATALAPTYCCIRCFSSTLLQVRIRFWPLDETLNVK